MAGCVGCVGLGWRWRIPGTQLRERGNILRWCLTGMQGAEHNEMWWNRGRKRSWVWNWVRKGWLLSRVQKVLGPEQEEKLTPHQGFLRTNPAHSRWLRWALQGLHSPQPVPVSVCHLPYIHTALVLHRERAVAVLPHHGKTVKKALQTRSTLTGRDWTPFLLRQDPFFPPGWESSGRRPGIRKPAHLPAFQVPLVNNRGLFLSQNHFKGSRAPEPCSPMASSVGAAYRSWVRTCRQLPVRKVILDIEQAKNQYKTIKSCQAIFIQRENYLFAILYCWELFRVLCIYLILFKGLHPQSMLRISSEKNKTWRKVEIRSFELRTVFILRQCYLKTPSLCTLQLYLLFIILFIPFFHYCKFKKFRSKNRASYTRKRQKIFPMQHFLH